MDSESHMDFTSLWNSISSTTLRTLCRWALAPLQVRSLAMASSFLEQIYSSYCHHQEIQETWRCSNFDGFLWYCRMGHHNIWDQTWSGRTSSTSSLEYFEWCSFRIWTCQFRKGCNQRCSSCNWSHSSTVDEETAIIFSHHGHEGRSESVCLQISAWKQS